MNFTDRTLPPNNYGRPMRHNIVMLTDNTIRPINIDFSMVALFLREPFAVLELE